MPRTVTVEIDAAKFYKCYTSISGDEAKEILLMLACGGHAVDSHSACLRDIGIKPAPCSIKPADEEVTTNAKIAHGVEDFFSEIGPVRTRDVFEALADRPKPGAKDRGRAAFTKMLGTIYSLRKSVEFAKPLRLTTSGAEHVFESEEEVAAYAR